MFKNIKYSNDINLGSQNELDMLPFFKNAFNDESIEMLDKYNNFDYKGDNKYIELKTRRNAKNTYPTTMIGKNKIDKAKTLNEDVYFVFKFTDGIFYYKFNKDDQLTTQLGGRKDRGCCEIKDYCFIDVNKLNFLLSV